MNKRIIWIDALRAICMLWVVGFWHLQEYMLTHLSSFNEVMCYQITYGVLALFYMISGYFAANSNIDSKKDVLLFYLRKLIRLYPFFIISSFLMYICHYNDLNSFLSSILFTGIFFHTPATLWFICNLFIYYLITPIFLKIHNKLIYFAAAVVSFMVFYLITSVIESDERLFFYFPFYIIGFFVGKLKPDFDKVLNFFCALISLAIFLVFSNHSGIDYNKGTYICVFSFIYTVSFFCFYFMKDLSRHRLIEFLSFGSLCSYMFHRPFYYFILLIFGKFSLIKAFFIYLPFLLMLGYLIQTAYNFCLKKFKIHRF